MPPPHLATVAAHDVKLLTEGWELARAPLGADRRALDTVTDWLPAEVPGTVASALRRAGRSHADDLDRGDWWFRTHVDVPRSTDDEEVVLRLDGVATVCDVFLDGVPIGGAESMFEPIEIDVSTVAGRRVELAVCCRALDARPHPRRPRARWRTRVAAGDLRWHRTTLLGRAPGFAAGPAPVGPWRSVRLETRRLLALHDARVRATMAGDDGALSVRLDGRWLGHVRPRLRLRVVGPTGDHDGDVEAVEADGSFVAETSVVLPAVERWFPHTHGTPALYAVTVVDSDGFTVVDLGSVGFRTIRPGPPGHDDVERDGLALQVNDVPVFARGVLWSSLDVVSLSEDATEIRRMLVLLRDAGANMIRVPGVATYLPAEFHDACDELGVLVWQDLMFANFDYPFEDAGFGTSVRREIAAELGAIAGRASLAVVCGGSEIAQQAAMFGLEPARRAHTFFEEDVPAVLAELECSAVYVPSSPWGGSLPFRFDRGVAHYFGVGGYRRPMTDVRRAEVRFASECLAFANVPEDAGLADVLPGAPEELVVTHPAWKAGVPRDVGSGWDFDDVRDHYLGQLYHVDPVALRATDHDRYLTLSRRVSGEVMQEVFCEWRRSRSPCAGGLVLWLRDLVPGAGWGLLDSAGRPKAAFHLVRRAWAPVAVWIGDEGLGGLRVHVANDGPAPLSGGLDVVFYRDRELPVETAHTDVAVGPHGAMEVDVEAILGRFVDAASAYGFGPPSHDLVVATLTDAGGTPVGQHIHFPSGRRSDPDPTSSVGLVATARPNTNGAVTVHLESRALALGIRVTMVGFETSEALVDLAPGAAHEVVLHPSTPTAEATSAEVTADNMRGSLMVDCRLDAGTSR